MKILHSFLVFAIYFAVVIPTYSSNVLCNSNNTECTMGKYTFKGTNLSAENGILCNSAKTFCTNGYALLRKGNTSVRKSELNNVRNQNTQNEIVQISEAEVLENISDLFIKGLINQTEFNRLKNDTSILDLDASYELNKLGSLYEKGLVTQFEFNKIKANIINK